MPEIANVRLRLPNRPENVLVVRQALTGVAGVLALDAIETNDLNTAVTEACNNVVMHAYEGEEGPMEVDAYVLPDTIAVVVRDRGVGIDPAAGAGMGLAVIDALAERVAFSQPPGGGTEVRIEFPLSGKKVILEALADGDGDGDGDGRMVHASARPASDGDAQTVAPPAWRRGGSSSAIEVELAPSELARAVLPRVLSALAARAHFSTDRISDVQIVADVLAANAGESIDGSHLAVGVTIARRNLELRVGPLRVGRGESVIAAAADGLAPVIERLTDGKRVAGDGSCETLELRLVDDRR
jgi:serine/threonine-protein kinase RsbW